MKLWEKVWAWLPWYLTDPRTTTIIEVCPCVTPAENHKFKTIIQIIPQIYFFIEIESLKIIIGMRI